MNVANVKSTKPRLSTAAVAAVAVVLALGLTAPSLGQGPQHCVAARGDVVITHNGNFWLIQAGHNSILECQSFDIASFETVQFLQPGSFSRILNRNTGNDVSNIDGTLLANGRRLNSTPPR